MKDILGVKRKPFSAVFNANERQCFAYAEFSIVTVVAFLIGIVLYWTLDFNSEHQVEICRYFEDPFDGCNSPTDIIYAIISASFADVLQLTVLFLFSFSSIYPLVSGAVFLYRGVILGYAVPLVGGIILSDGGSTAILILLYFADFALKAVVTCMAAKMASLLFSQRVNADTDRNVAKVVLSNVSCLAISMGSVLAFHTLYCLLLYIFT